MSHTPEPLILWTAEQRCQAALESARSNVKSTVYNAEDTMSQLQQKLDDSNSALRNICRLLTRSNTWSAVEKVDLDAGMSIRDWFAGMVLQGLSSSLKYTGQGWSVRWDETTQEAYRAADAMIARQERLPHDTISNDWSGVARRRV